MASILSLLCFGFSIHDAKAETFHMYIEKMPRHWQKQFDGVLDEAMQYWQNKFPDLAFEQVQFVDKADFVVEWASMMRGSLAIILQI